MTTAANVESVATSRMGIARRETLYGLLFISPWIIGFLIFFLVPMIASLVFSFTNYDLIHPDETEFIGLDNYQKLFEDPIVGVAAEVTLKFACFAIPIAIVFPLFLAVLLNTENLWGKPLIRTLFFMPSIIPLVAVVLIWNGFLNTETGWLNLILDQFGIGGPEWLNSTFWIYPALLLMGLWGTENAMLTMLAGLQNVPTELYEAAKVDGAGPITTFRKITVPMISPIIFYNLVLVVIATGQYFLIPFVLKGPTGNPGNSTMFFNMYFFKTAFTFNQMGYGATLAWVLFLVSLLVTAVLFYTAKYWVYYAVEER